MDVLFGVGNLIGGLAVGIGIMYLRVPYFKAQVLNRISRHYWGVAELEANNINIESKVIRMDETEVQFSDKPDAPRFWIAREFFRNKSGAPTIHFNYTSPNPVTFMRKVTNVKMFPAQFAVNTNQYYLTPAKFKIKTKKKEGVYDYKDIEVQPNLVKIRQEDGTEQEINEPYIIEKKPIKVKATVEDIEVLPVKIVKKDKDGNPLRDEEGNEVKEDHTWIKEKEVLIEPPEIFPERLGSLINKIRARAETEASIQRWEELKVIVNTTKIAMIVGVITAFLVLSIAYLLPQYGNDISTSKEITLNLTREFVNLNTTIQNKAVTVLPNTGG